MTEGSPRCCASRRADDVQPASGEAAAALGSIEPSQTPIARRWSAPIGGAFTMGSNDRRFPADGEGPPRRVTVSDICHRLPRRQQSPVRRFRSRHRLHHRRRTIWLEFCLRGVPARRDQARDRQPGRRYAVVGAGAACLLGAARGPAQHDPRPARSSRGACLLERRQGLLPMVRHAAAERGGMGDRRARRARRGDLSLGR